MQHDIIFIRNIFRLNIDCADLLASFVLHIPTRSTRAYKLFNEPRARVNTIQSSLFCRLPRVANSFLNKCNRVDVFNDTFHAFKRAFIRYVNEMWLAMRWPTNFSIYPTSPISGVFPVGDWMNKWNENEMKYMWVGGWVCMVFGIISRTKARSATNETLKCKSPERAFLRHNIIGVRLPTSARRAKMPK